MRRSITARLPPLAKLAAAAGGVVLLVLLVVRAALPNPDMSRRGADWSIHALFVERLANPAAAPGTLLARAPAGAERLRDHPEAQIAIERELHGYPLGAHALAAWGTPAFSGDVVQSMRGVGLAALAAMFVAQYRVLRSFAAPWPAFAGLMLWQGLAGELKLGNVNHLHGNYFYPQAVGAAAYWMMLAVLAGARGRSWAVEAAALGLAAGALACHLVPGAAAVGTLAARALLGLRREPGWRPAAGLAAALGVAWTLAVASGQLAHMARNAEHNGAMDLRHPAAQCVALGLAAMVALRRVGRLARRDEPTGGTEAAGLLALALLAALGLQALVAGKYLAGLGGTPYAIKKFLLLTTPLALLTLAAEGVPALRRGLARRFPQGSRLGLAGPLAAVCCVVLAAPSIERLLEKERRSPAALRTPAERAAEATAVLERAARR